MAKLLRVILVAGLGILLISAAGTLSCKGDQDRDVEQGAPDTTMGQPDVTPDTMPPDTAVPMPGDTTGMAGDTTSRPDTGGTGGM
jgi:hypothetical protein